MLRSLFRRPPQDLTAAPTVAGQPARVPPGACVYAVGDIHGRADLLEEMHRLIVEDAATLTPGTGKRARPHPPGPVHSPPYGVGGAA